MKVPTIAPTCVHAPAKMKMAVTVSTVASQMLPCAPEKCLRAARPSVSASAMRIRNAEKGARNKMLGRVESMEIVYSGRCTVNKTLWDIR